MRTLAMFGGLALIALALTSCATGQATYLEEATNRATQHEAAKRLGLPQLAWDLTTGETLWRYQSGFPSGAVASSISVAGPGWVIAGSSQCTEYVLLFDQEQVLRAWRERRC